MTIIYTREPNEANNMEKDIKTMIDEAFETAVTDTTHSESDNQPTPVNQLDTFKDAESYRKATGKRFRMTKEEISRGLSREQAFEERARAGRLEV